MLRRNAGVAASQIGVIALYKAQANLLRKKIDEQCGVGDGAILVSTVDAFQGGERDIILISSARSSSVGFTDNAERLNVALTRARHHLIIIGHAGMLEQGSKTWAAVMGHGAVEGGTADQMIGHLVALRPTATQSKHDDDCQEEQNSEQQAPVAAQGQDEVDMEACAAAGAPAQGSSAGQDDAVLSASSPIAAAVAHADTGGWPHEEEEDEADMEAWAAEVAAVESAGPAQQQSQPDIPPEFLEKERADLPPAQPPPSSAAVAGGMSSHDAGDSLSLWS